MPACCIGKSSCFDRGGGFNRRIILRGKSLKIPRNISLSDYFTKMLASKQINGSKTALIYEGIENYYTFDAFDDMSTKLANTIKNDLFTKEWTNNNEDGDIVIAFCLGTTDKMILCIIAILKLGCTYLPIDQLCPEEYLVRIINSTKPIMIITESSSPIQTRFNCVAKLTNLVTIDNLFEIAKTLPSDLNNVIPLSCNLETFERTAAIYYSSGTTGQCRGARIGHLSILNRIMWQWDAVPYEENDVSCLMTQPIIHTSMTDIFGPILAGKTLVILNRVTIPKPDFIITNVYTKGVTRITVSSEVLSSILSTIQNNEDPASLIQQLCNVSVWFCTGDMLTAEICQIFFKVFHSSNATVEFQDLNQQKTDSKPKPVEIQSLLNKSPSLLKSTETLHRPLLVHLYGGIETTADCAFEIFRNASDLNDKLDAKGRVPLGIPISNTQIFLIPIHGNRILAEGFVAEICVSGLSLASGYTSDVPSDNFIKNPIKGSNDFATMFRTSDLGRISQSHDEELRLYFEGRCNSIIKLRGKKIDLNEIGRKIKITGLVNDVEVFGFHENFDDEIVVAAVVLKENIQPNSISIEIKGKIRGVIPEIFPVEQVPRLPDGRLDRFNLVQKYKKSRGTCSASDWNSTGIASEQMEHAKILCAEVSACLGVSLRFVVTNFQNSYWNLGGNSHNVLILLQRLKNKGYNLSPDEFISSENLPIILEKLTNNNNSEPHNWENLFQQPSKLAGSLFTLIPLSDVHRDDVFKIISNAYPEKSDLALHVSAEFTDYEEFLDFIWEDLIKQNLSTVVISRFSNAVVGVNLVTDANSHALKIKKLNKPIRYIYELYEFCEKSSKIHLTLNAGKLIQPFMFATNDTLSYAHNILVTQLLLKETMEKGKSLEFKYIFISSTLPLIKQICRIILNCDVLLEYPINQFIASDKTRPFHHTGTNCLCSVYSKPL